MLALVVTVIVIALVFAFTNGFHDASNAIATSVSTRALTPRRALLMAALMNLLGAMLGTEVAHTIGSGIISIDASTGTAGLVVVLAGLIGAVTWNLVTWWFGLPSSSSHALIGGLAGAGLASGVSVHWATILDKVIIPMLVSPLGGFILSYLVMTAVLRLLAGSPYHRTMRRFRLLQTVSAAAVALGHGLQDAQKTMGVVVIALAAGGYHSLDAGIPWWVVVAAAGAISLGTYTGGARIMRTLGSRVIDLDPAQGFVAETVSAGLLYVAAFMFGAPVSTTHTITAGIAGVGATRRLSAVRWGVAGNIVTAWVLTLPAAGLVSALLARLLGLLL